MNNEEIFNPTDDLTRTNPNLSSTFYSKDSALGLSDDNLHQLSKFDEKSNILIDH